MAQTLPLATPAPLLSDETEYQPFADVAQRNLFQEFLEVPALVKLLDLQAGLKVLEVGCGRGIALPPLSDLLSPEHLHGLDIDPDLIGKAEAHLQERGIAAGLTVGDVRAMPFPDASFDLIIDFGTCHHIKDPDEALREIVRVLKPGGLFVAETVTSQLLSHPLRTRLRRLPWKAVPELKVLRGRVLWKTRMRRGLPPDS